MGQLSLNDKIFKEMHENENIHDGLAPNTATNIAEKFVREIALEFPMWLQQNRWFNYEEGKWRYTFEHGTALGKAYYDENHAKTNEELFSLYLKEKYK